MKKRYESVPSAEEVDPTKVMAFFEKRKGPDGRPISELLDAPVPRSSGGWFSCKSREFDERGLPANSIAGSEVPAEWETAWHGCKFEALYSIMYQRELIASEDRKQGHRFFDGKPGIYLDKDGLSEKAEYYIRFVPLFEDGVFWAAMWEARVDRGQRVTKADADQWIQRPGSTRLAALWL